MPRRTDIDSIMILGAGPIVIGQACEFDYSGAQACKALRDDGLTMPVLILSARGEEIDKVRGLRLGADDYVTKPFGLMELLARVEAMLRRGDSPPSDEDAVAVIRIGDLEICPRTRSVHRGGEPVELAPREFDLLLELLAAAAVRHDRGAQPGGGRLTPGLALGHHRGGPGRGRRPDQCWHGVGDASGRVGDAEPSLETAT